MREGNIYRTSLADPKKTVKKNWLILSKTAKVLNLNPHRKFSMAYNLILPLPFLSPYNLGGEGHWNVNCIGPQSFANVQLISGHF